MNIKSRWAEEAAVWRGTIEEASAALRVGCVFLSVEARGRTGCGVFSSGVWSWAVGRRRSASGARRALGSARPAECAQLSREASEAS
jgi:hypothetical protein